jgi:hypothetical protein
VFAADTVSGVTAGEHEHALSVVLPRFGDVLTADQVLAEFAGG